jgi:hypothetical protein
MFIDKNDKQMGISTLSSGHMFVLGSKASGHEDKEQLIFDETTKTSSSPCRNMKASNCKTEVGLVPENVDH